MVAMMGVVLAPGQVVLLGLEGVRIVASPQHQSFSGVAPNWYPPRAFSVSAVPTSARLLKWAETVTAAGGCPGTKEPKGNCSVTNLSPGTPQTVTGAPVVSSTE